MDERGGGVRSEPSWVPVPGMPLAEQAEMFGSIALSAPSAIVAADLAGQVVWVNPLAAEVLGREPDQLLGRPVADLLSAGADGALLDQPRPEPVRYDVDYHRPDGSDRVLAVSASTLRSADGTALGWLALLSDVTEERSVEADLRRQALHDPLTGLPNRVLFFDRLATAEARQERSGGSIALLFLDLDDFKQVNDAHGHETGDALLVQVASRLAEAVRATDTVARLGGDEFAIICEDADHGVVELVAQRVHKRLEEPVDLAGRSVHVGVSIGAALAPPHPVSELLRLADSAMYLAKAEGPAHVTIYAEDR